MSWGFSVSPVPKAEFAAAVDAAITYLSGSTRR